MTVGGALAVNHAGSRTRGCRVGQNVGSHPRGYQRFLAVSEPAAKQHLFDPRFHPRTTHGNPLKGVPCGQRGIEEVVQR